MAQERAREARKNIQVQLEVEEYANELGYIRLLVNNREWKPTFIKMLRLQMALDDGDFTELANRYPDFEDMRKLKISLDSGDSAELQRQYPELWRWMLEEARRQAREEAMDYLKALPKPNEGKPSSPPTQASYDKKSWMDALKKLD